MIAEIVSEVQGRLLFLEAIRYQPISLSQALEIENVVIDNAKKNGVPVALVLALIAVESEFRNDAMSSEGAMGLMQIMYETGNRYGNRKIPVEKAMYIPAMNISIGIKYLADLNKKYRDWGKVLNEYGGFIKKPSKVYVERVLRKMREYQIKLGE
jgi:soluble lytic murein transglycosylase-like protein